MSPDTTLGILRLLQRLAEALKVIEDLRREVADLKEERDNVIADICDASERD